MSIRGCLGTALMLIAALPAWAQSDADEFEQWDDWEEDTSVITGYLEYRYARRLSDNERFPHRTVRDEWKLKFEADDQIGAASWNFDLDLYADGLIGRARADLREATLALPLYGSAQLKLGRQVLGWGTGDLVFVNDRFPKNFAVPLSGGEDFYFKAPSNTLRLLAPLGALNIDLAYTPEFTPDRFPDGRRLSIYDPQLGALVGGSRRLDPPRPSGAELALRLATSRDGVEYALYGYRGYDKQPLSADAGGAPRFRRRDSAGASVRAPLWGGIAAFELGKEWRGSAPMTDSAVVPGKIAAILNYEHELLPKLTASVQAYHERYEADARARHPLAQGERQLISLRLTQLSLQDRLQLSVIQLYSPNREDHWLRGNLNYRFGDTWLGGAQINLFGGPQSTMFGQFEQDSQWALWLRRQF